jgi:hypothetical protein
MSRNRGFKFSSITVLEAKFAGPVHRQIIKVKINECMQMFIRGEVHGSGI